MRLMLASLLLFFSVLLPLRAEVFVDFTVSHGGEPLGTFRARLYLEEAPRICANFVGLATGQRPWLDPRVGRLRKGVPFYDGLEFHRLMHDFMIQGGDPLGTGGGGPGYVVQEQFHPSARHSGRYFLSMAHAGPHTNGSQFFITLEAAPHLDDYHSVFGEIIAGREIIDGFTDAARFPTSGENRPDLPIRMESVVVSGSGLEAFLAEHGEAGLPRWERVEKDISYRLSGSEDAAAPQLLVHWERQRKWDYPVLGSSDLEEWGILGFGLSMDNDPDFSTDVTNVYPPTEEQPLRAFFQVLGLDYSHLPDAPQSVIEPGAELELLLGEGVLRVVFGDEAGTWSFEPSDGGEATSGATDDFWEDAQNVVPDTGFFVGGERTLAQLMVVRMVTVLFDAPVGPRGLTAIQPKLSFHSETEGWFDGQVNAEQGSADPFRGQFVIRLP